jgi:protocatechuate 3,4-dioxygenase beta subunit
MADPKGQTQQPEGTDQNVPQQAPQGQEQVSLTQAIREAFSSIAREQKNPALALQGEIPQLDYAPEGGRYVVRGQVVDAEGKPLKDYRATADGAIVKA